MWEQTPLPRCFLVHLVTSWWWNRGVPSMVALNIFCPQHQHKREASWGPGVLNHPPSRAQLPALSFLNPMIACGVLPDMREKKYIIDSMAFPGPFDWLESRVAYFYEAGLTGLEPDWGDWENTGLEVSPRLSTSESHGFRFVLSRLSLALLLWKGKALSGTGLSCVFSCLHILRHQPNPSIWVSPSLHLSPLPTV